MDPEQAFLSYAIGSDPAKGGNENECSMRKRMIAKMINDPALKLASFSKLAEIIAKHKLFKLESTSPDSNLWGANLTNANLVGAHFGGANLLYAKLQGADLRNAYLWRADLRDANFKGARYSKKTTFNSGFNPKDAGMIFDA